METQLTMQEVYGKFPPDQYIHVVPSVSKIHMGPTMWGIDVATVKVDPWDKNDAYPIKKKWDPQSRSQIVEEVCLTASSIGRIGAAADVNVLPEVVIDDPGSMTIVIRATAIMQTPGGAVRGRACQVRWNGNLMRDKIRLNAESYVERACREEWNGFKGLSQDARARKVEEKFMREWIAEQEFGERKTESKACRNAIASILTLPMTYDPHVLERKSFCVVKYVFAPDLSDPETKKMVIEHGLDAQRRLFGQAAASASNAQFLPAQDAVPQIAAGEVETVDVYDDAPVSAAEPAVEEAPAASTGTTHDAQEGATSGASPTPAWNGVQDVMASTIAKQIQAMTDVKRIDDFSGRLAAATADKDTEALHQLYADIREVS